MEGETLGLKGRTVTVRHKARCGSVGFAGTRIEMYSVDKSFGDSEAMPI